MSDLLVVATPTYKGTYTGLLKSFFDRYPANGLSGTLALPVMTVEVPRIRWRPGTGLAPLLLELGAIVLGRGLYFDMADIERLDEVLDDSGAGKHRRHRARGCPLPCRGPGGQADGALTLAMDLDARVRQFSPATAHSQPVRDLFNNVPTAVTALCAVIDGVPRGLVATSLSVGVSYEPPMVAFSVRFVTDMASPARRAPHRGFGPAARWAGRGLPSDRLEDRRPVRRTRRGDDGRPGALHRRCGQLAGWPHCLRDPSRRSRTRAAAHTPGPHLGRCRAAVFHRCTSVGWKPRSSVRPPASLPASLTCFAGGVTWPVKRSRRRHCAGLRCRGSSCRSAVGSRRGPGDLRRRDAGLRATRIFTADPTGLLSPPNATAADRAAVGRLGLSDPLPLQYLHYLRDLLTETSVPRPDGQPVTADLLERLPATAELARYALLLGILGGVTAGVLAAVFEGSVWTACYGWSPRPGSRYRSSGWR